MKIAFDAKRAFHNNSGLGNYSRGVLSCLNSYYPELELHLLSPFQKNHLAAELALSNKTHYFKGPLKNLRRVTASAKLANKINADIFHGLSNELPKGIRNGTIKTVVTIHDLIFLRYPQFYSKIDRKIYLQKTKYAIANSDVIITTSNQTKSDLEHFFGAGNKCITIYQHVSQFLGAEELTQRPHTNPYLLYVSSFEKRKNHLTLLNAFNSIKEQTDFNLVLIGRPKESYQEVIAFIKKEKLEERVHLIANASSAHIKNYLTHAKGFVYPSFYEGFGIPLIEALQNKLPIACSNLPVFKEIAMEHAFFFDPESVSEIANNLLKVSNYDYDQKKKDKISQHLNIFSAQNHADKLYQCYEKL